MVRAVPGAPEGSFRFLKVPRGSFRFLKVPGASAEKRSVCVCVCVGSDQADLLLTL